MKTVEEREVIEKTLPLIKEAFLVNNLNLELTYDYMADCVYVTHGTEILTVYCSGTS